MSADVTVTMFPAGLNRLLTGSGSGSYQLLLRLGNATLNGARNRCPVDTGYLRSSGELTSDAAVPSVEVAFRAHYAIYVHDGTRYMQGRPFLQEALNEEMSRL